jgi:hypothetical protein
MTRRRIVTIAIVLAILLVKAYFLTQFSQSAGADQATAFSNGDAGHYLTIGKNLADFGAYADNQSAIPTEKATWRPPIWPWLLSVFFWFSDKLTVILALKIALELAIGFWALTKLRKRFNLDPKIYFALFLIFLEPQLLKYDTTFLTESLSATLLFALAVSFMTTVGRKISFGFILLCAAVILCHPISVFCVATLFAIYLYKAGRQQWQRIVISIVIFVLAIAAWPLRNALTFQKGMYLTASQGTTFSKGWNGRVASDFTNVTGDLASEDDNLKYLQSNTPLPADSPVSMSKIYKQATWAFIDQASLAELSQIAFRKLTANFNPLPEQPKSGLLETAGSGARALYLINFIALAAYRFFHKRMSNVGRAAMPVVFAILVGQVLMSIYIYTGFRFNSIYGMISLACLLLILADVIPGKFIKKRV